MWKAGRTHTIGIWCKCGKRLKMKVPGYYVPKSYVHCKPCNLTWVRLWHGRIYSHPWKIKAKDNPSVRVDFHYYDNFNAKVVI